MQESRSSFRLLSIVGARPQFIKLAPLTRAIADWNQANTPRIEHITVHTGQHYDANMSDIFFEEMEIPRPDVNLGIGSGSHGKQTGAMLEGLEAIMLEHKPDIVIIFGDTNSTLAGALAAAKLHIPLAHIEAGLRSFNRRMPEEVNRITADHLSEILLAPTPTAIENLQNEGLASRTFPSGDIMYDTVLHNLKLAARRSTLLADLNLQPHTYSVLTVHRAENTNAPERLAAILNTFNELAEEGHTLVFPMHPRTKHLLPKVLPDWEPHANLRIIEPIGYLDMVWLVNHAQVVLTDSGGLQKEAFFMKVPCITLRDETEWVETVTAGGNIITSANERAIKAAFSKWQDAHESGSLDFTQHIESYFGRGSSGPESLQVIMNWLHEHTSFTTSPTV